MWLGQKLPFEITKGYATMTRFLFMGMSNDVERGGSNFDGGG